MIAWPELNGWPLLKLLNPPFRPPIDRPMALSNRDRIGKALDQLAAGLLPYVSLQLYNSVGSD